MTEKCSEIANNSDNEGADKDILPGYTNLEHFTKDGFKTLIEAIKNANALPNGRDWNFYTTHESFNKIIDNEGGDIMKLINSTLRHYKIEGNVRNRVLEEKTELIVEANDVILERVANNIDEMNGIRKSTLEPVLIQAVSAQLPVNGSWNRVTNATFSVSSSITPSVSSSKVNSIRLLTAKNILRPQKFFKDKINNNSNYAWEPRITEKPNSIKPLAIFLEETANGEEFSHPYEIELERFQPSEEQLKEEKPVHPKPIEKTPLIEVSAPEQLDELVETLRNCKVFAVDLEHHSYRSFMGITCLMQISTAEKDYIIDTLTLRDHLHILNEVFTKPTIIKIFHGAEMDVQWLQRDLSLYVVNMFDTHQAAKHLGYSGLSLAYLMNRFCNFMPNKQFQLADWRIRPLPEELKSYAREDTHYLIYIYQMLKKELLEKANKKNNLLKSVFNQSTEICKRRYFKLVLREDSYMDFYRKCKRLFDNRQLYALRELYKWRDQLSREEDESTGYVLPNHMLLQISESLPREMQGILACCNPIPPLVRANLLELHKVILKAREQPLEKAILKEDPRARGATIKMSKVNVDSPLNCPHDLSRSSEFRDDLPTLLDKKICISGNLAIKANASLSIEKGKPAFSVFNTPENSDNEELANETFQKLHKFKFLGPYERYKMVKPFIQAEEERLAEEKAKVEVDTNNSGVAAVVPTDEERIESIRKHFLNLSQKTVETPPEQSLIEMGGAKKRKRPLSGNGGDYHPDYEIPANNLHTTVPKWGNPRKRRSEDPSGTLQGEGARKVLKVDEEQRRQQSIRDKKRNKQQKKKGVVRGNPQGQTTSKPQQQQQNPQKNPQQKNPQKSQNFGKNQKQQGFQKNPQQQVQGFQPQNKGNKRINKQKPQQRFGEYSNNPPNASGSDQLQPCQYFEGDDPRQLHQNTFSSFDYSSVDFRQFQGGAGGVQRPQEFKSNFKSKGRKRNNNKGLNKSLTFGSGGNSRGRGR